MEFKLSKEQRRLKKDIVCFAKEQLKDDTLAVREGNHEFSREFVGYDAASNAYPGTAHPRSLWRHGLYSAMDLALAHRIAWVMAVTMLDCW